MQLALTVDWWPPEKAAELLGVSPDHVRHLCREGSLTAVQERRRWWVSPASVRSYLARRTRERAAFVRSGKEARSGG